METELISLRSIDKFSLVNRRPHFSKDKRRDGNFIRERDREKSSDTDRSEAATEGSAFFRVQRASLRRLDPWPTSFVSLHDRFAAVNRRRNLRCDHRSLHANNVGESKGVETPSMSLIFPFPPTPAPPPKTASRHSRGSEAINEIDDDLSNVFA